MPFLYIYSPSDFINALPIEANGGTAAGSGNYTLQLKPGATPTLIEVTDDDLIFDEIDSTQSLTNTINLDGNSYSAGTTINTAYDLTNSDTDHQVTTFHFGGDGYQQGSVDGLVSTIPLEEGVEYNFDSRRTSHQEDNRYEDFVACFTTGAAIETKRGLIYVQDLVVGDMILTLDNGFQPLRLILQRSVSSTDLVEKPKLRPVRITAGALGQGMPARDLLVSPQHRFLTHSPIAKRMFGEAEVLISAKKLTALPGIWVEEACEKVVYYHLVMDQHEIVYAEGAPTESYFFGKMALLTLDPEARIEMETLFPELFLPNFTALQARPIPTNKKQLNFAQRHEKNSKPLLMSNVSLSAQHRTRDANVVCNPK
jgi:hypothetical protein